MGLNSLSNPFIDLISRVRLNRNANDAALMSPSYIDHDDVMLTMVMIIIINDVDDDNTCESITEATILQTMFMIHKDNVLI